jgi:O-acetyl-ADP-ribose deacetylase (regulator of RNase III)
VANAFALSCLSLSFLTREFRHGDLCKEEVGAIVNAANEFLSHGGGVAKSIATAAGCDGIVDKESAEWVAKNGPVLTGRGAAITSAGALPCKFVVHVAGPIWRKPVENEIEVRGEIISVENGVATLMAPECGTITCRRHTLASGYVPQEGDRARACVSKPRPAPPGGKTKAGSGGYSVRYIAGTKHEISHSDEELLQGAVLAALRKADEAKCESVALPAISSGIFGFPLALCAQILVECGVAFAKEGPK